MSNPLPARLRETHAIIAVLDLQRTRRIVEEIGDLKQMVLFLDQFYELCSNAVTANGGDVIKYDGDGCLASFADTDPQNALDAIGSIRSSLPVLCQQFGCTPTDLHAAVHCGDFVTGTFGPEGYRDAIGPAVNTAYRLDRRGGKITLSEVMYRKLASDKRGPFRKQAERVAYVAD